MLILTARRRVDAHHQIVLTIGQDGRGGADDPVGRVQSRVDAHHVLRHRVDATGLGAAEAAMGDQVGRFLVLDQIAPAAFVLIPTALMPGKGISDGHQQAAVGIGPVAQFGVLPAPARERFVASAHQVVKALADPEVASGDSSEHAIVPGGQIVGPDHVSRDPGRVRRPVREQICQRPRPGPDHLRVDAVRCDVSTEPDGQGIGDDVVPAGVRRDPARLGQRVAVEKEQDVVRRRPNAGVAGSGDPEPLALLPHHRDVQRSRARPRERRL